MHAYAQLNFKMATIFKECTIEKQGFFCGQNDPGTDIYKEMFPVYGDKCSSRKAVHNWLNVIEIADQKLCCRF